VRPKTVRASGGGIEPALGQHPEAVGMTAGQAGGFQIVHPIAPRRHDHRHRTDKGRSGVGGAKGPNISTPVCASAFLPLDLLPGSDNYGSPKQGRRV